MNSHEMNSLRTTAGEGPQHRRWVVRLAVAIALLLACAGAARAQSSSHEFSRIELFAGYSYIRAHGSPSGTGFDLHGGSVSAAYNFNHRIGIVADFGRYTFAHLPSGLESTMYTYLFGPRITLARSRRFHPFAQALLGGGRLNASAGGVSAGENGLALALGGGLDARLSKHFAIRIVQAEYLLTRFQNTGGSSATQNNARISAGLVIHLGGR